MQRRFDATHVEAWRNTGFALVPGFFTPEELAPVYADFDRLYAPRAPARRRALSTRTNADERPRFDPAQFELFDTLPFAASPAMNLIGLHAALIDFARALLGVDRVHCYQVHSWAKFTGAADYDQPLHCDFGNHTLTVPGDRIEQRAVDFIIYVTDVSDDLGALHYVTKPDAARVLPAGALHVPDDQHAALAAYERSAAGPAGTVVAHGIDTLHRGTNLTRDDGVRYTMTAGYKAAGNEMIGFHVWQSAPGRPWRHVLEHASPEQLATLGIPLPGEPFWTERTLELTQARWPGWDMRAYFAGVRT